MGTGTSEGIPRASCLTNPLKTCEVCSKAAEPGNKNRRLNTSILIRCPSSSGRRSILIDAGKFFYHSALRWFPAGLRTIDAVIITHSHADAIGGLDDLRDWTNNVQPSIPIYVVRRDFEVMKKTHYYLVDTRVVTPDYPHYLYGMVLVTAFSVFVLVIFVTSAMLVKYLKKLILSSKIVKSSSWSDRSSATHFGLPRALEEVRKIQPKRTLFTGMMHLMDHEKLNSYLSTLTETEGLDVQLSYDGLCVPVTL